MQRKTCFTPLKVIPLSIAIVVAMFMMISSKPLHTKASGIQPTIGPKQSYMALGDSLAFGYQPNNDFSHGYNADLFAYLQKQGVTDKAFLGCPGETSQTFINGGCPYAPAGSPSQLSQATNYIKTHPGQVSPITLQIGANDVLKDIDRTTCKVNTYQFEIDLLNLDKNLTQTILPKLSDALKGSNGQLTADIFLLNYYDPFQNVCPPDQVAYLQQLNMHLAIDISYYGQIVDVFGAFGGATRPNTNISTLTWITSQYQDIHATTAGYKLITSAIIKTLARNAVSPILECIRFQGNGIYSASFGYNNPNAYAAEIPPGVLNYFTSKNYTQPELFLAGRHRASFQITFNGGILIWILNGYTSTASSSSQPC